MEAEKQEIEQTTVANLPENLEDKPVEQTEEEKKRMTGLYLAML